MTVVIPGNQLYDISHFFTLRVGLTLAIAYGIYSSYVPTKTEAMGEIATSDRQITLFYSSKSTRAKQTLVYAKAEGLPIQEIDILKNPPTGTQIAEIADRLGIKIADLVNQEHPAYKAKFDEHVLSSDDWIKMIRHNPDIMKQPIAIRGNITILVETPTDIIKI